jgi:hypothetical protein
MRQTQKLHPLLELLRFPLHHWTKAVTVRPSPGQDGDQPLIFQPLSLSNHVPPHPPR